MNYEPWFLNAIISLLIATLLGMSLGVERVYAQKTAGMRTYALISMASALFVLISLNVFSPNGYNIDSVMRVASQIIPGVGFIGAGLIIFKKDRLLNVTTATAIWVAAGVGMASGFGLYELAIFATILTLFVLEGLAFVERKLKNKFKEAREINDLNEG